MGAGEVGVGGDLRGPRGWCSEAGKATEMCHVLERPGQACGRERASTSHRLCRLSFLFEFPWQSFVMRKFWNADNQLT